MNMAARSECMCTSLIVLLMQIYMHAVTVDTLINNYDHRVLATAIESGQLDYRLLSADVTLWLTCFDLVALLLVVCL